jgi:hypothetical protein
MTFLKNVSQISRQREVMKILGIECMHHTRQLCKFEVKMNKIKEQKGRKCKLRTNYQ